MSDTLSDVLSSPGVDTLAGMAQAFGQAAMPTRMPTPWGAVLGAGAGGMLSGLKESQQLQQQQQQLQSAKMQNQVAAATLPATLAQSRYMANMWSNPAAIQQMTGFGVTPTAPPSAPSTDQSAPTFPTSGGTPGSSSVPLEQRASLVTQANQGLKIPPSLQYGLIDYETGGGWNPTVTNKDSGASGLPQALASTAANPGYGTPPIDISKASPLQQANWAGQYLQNRGQAAGVTDWTDPAQVTKALIAYHGPQADANGIDGPTYAQNVLARSSQFAPMVMKYGRSSSQAAPTSGFSALPPPSNSANPLTPPVQTASPGVGSPPPVSSGTSSIASMTPDQANAKAQGLIQQANTLEQQQKNAALFKLPVPNGDPVAIRAQAAEWQKFALAGATKTAEGAANAPFNMQRIAPGGVVTDGTGHIVASAPRESHEVVTTGPNTGMPFTILRDPVDGHVVAPSGATSAVEGMPPGAIPTGMTPITQEFMHERGENLANQFGQIDADAASAKAGNFLFDNLRNDSQSWQPGRFADWEGDARSWLSAVGHTVGISDTDPDMKALDTKLGDYQAFLKSSGTLLRTAVHDVSSRAAVQEYNLISQTLPHPTTSAQGFGQVADQWQGINDFHIAKQKFAQNYQNHPQDFNVDFNSQVSPTSFMLNRMQQTPQGQQDAQAMFSRLQATPEGRQQIGHIQQQYRFARDAGLFDGLPATATPSVQAATGGP